MPLLLVPFLGAIKNREEKSLRHVAMVAKFLDDIKPETSLKEAEADQGLSLHLYSYCLQSSCTLTGSLSFVLKTLVFRSASLH